MPILGIIAQSSIFSSIIANQGTTAHHTNQTTNNHFTAAWLDQMATTAIL